METEGIQSTDPTHLEYHRILQLQNERGDVEARQQLADEFVKCRIVLGELSAALAAKEKEIDELHQFVKDTSDEMECLPTCDSVAHDENCPVINTQVAWRKLRAELEAVKGKRLKELREACGFAIRWITRDDAVECENLAAEHMAQELELKCLFAFLSSRPPAPDGTQAEKEKDNG